MITKGVISEVEVLLNKFFEVWNCSYSLEATSGNVVIYQRTLDFDFIDYLVFSAINVSDGNGAECTMSIGGVSKYSDSGINDGERIHELIDCTAITGDNEVRILYNENSAISGFLQDVTLFKYDEDA